MSLASCHPLTLLRSKRWLRLVISLSPGFLVLLQVGCNHSAPAAQGPKPVEVVATTPIAYDVTDYQDFTGRLDAFETVDIRPRASGYVTEVPFKEGDEVHEGDLLFQIDPRPYQVDLNQAEANLKQAEADRVLQEKIAARGRQLINGGTISKEEYDTNVASAAKARATVGAMQAACDRCKLYLSFTRVTAPFHGRISRRFVDPGNLVKADDTILTSLVNDDPVYAYFDVDERTYLDLLKTAKHGPAASWMKNLQFPVLMRLANEEEFQRAGTVNFIDNRVIGTSGTIRMRGLFKNPKGGILKSGLFVRIRLPIGQPYPSLLIPDEAVLSDQGRKKVYVVNAENVVEYRAVEIGQAIQGLRVIKTGLSPGDRVIIKGMQRVRLKAAVQVTMQPPPKPPDSPLGRLVAKHAGSGPKLEDRGQKTEDRAAGPARKKVAEAQ
jgi:RND family efflux transporter MFP subunit